MADNPQQPPKNPFIVAPVDALPLFTELMVRAVRAMSARDIQRMRLVMEELHIFFRADAATLHAEDLAAGQLTLVAHSGLSPAEQQALSALPLACQTLPQLKQPACVWQIHSNDRAIAGLFGIYLDPTRLSTADHQAIGLIATTIGAWLEAEVLAALRKTNGAL